MGTTTPPEDATPRTRDAVNTRRLLLRAARRRFARDGYTATTVRDIAADAGVNVALISRYFDSKEGLFEACITRVGEELGGEEAAELTVERVLRKLVEGVAGIGTDEASAHLVLLLRSSGDGRADLIRRSIMREFAEGMAGVAGWRPGDAVDDGILLRAQIALATALGIALLRSSAVLEPLASASADELSEPLREVLAILLAPEED